MSAKRKGDRTALLSCAAYAAEICTKSASTTGGVQLAVFSYGFNMVECTARLFSSLPSDGKITVVCIPHGGNVNDISRFTEDLKLEMGLLEVPLLVHSIEDGTGTKERCREYQSGGVVICSSRNFCMDLLHRRVSVDLVELCVFIFPRYMNTNFLTGSVSSAAFSIEILLRGAGHSTKSKAKIFSDDARWAASMVQRHHMGLENFIRELHISDVQLFPRFRLEFVKHFESISQQHSLNVTCVDLPVEESTALLDSCLRKILVEVLSELVKLEKTVLKNSHHSDATEKGDHLL
ncbi:hypothetical protein AGDE_12545 [Angomonas deanei]|uniref:Uncharacterized protein n=1 Tax=Angomonas deanei TaxID=59799 RepID=A0A7G2CAY1_9TRYP|nr:hypothetical protein AGDE_12545 [Angomonas deanei]CAD2217020.1 hypothetical protein, conserved [Angomonas deanei]|eukprot:EPY24167.1 hypothetical protein AGDE_12545 [Angomonas deanei]